VWYFGHIWYPKFEEVIPPHPTPLHLPSHPLPPFINRVLDLNELFQVKLKLVLDLVEQFGHLDISLLDLNELFLEELKLELVLVE
jgi:hypothetical protein